MECLTEEHLKDFLSEEWLVRTDTTKSIPYLFKFHHSCMDLSCMVLVTDTKSVWAEVVDGKQFARRWRSLNSNSPAPYDDQADEDSWRETNLELLSNLHTLGAISSIKLEVVDSNFSDFAFELDAGSFKWRWETNSVGYRQAAEILSKQLIMPLISLNHLSLSSPDALSGMTDLQIEKAVDTTARSGRRAPDNHVKNALCKPRTATMLRRMTAMFNFVDISNLPPIFSTAEKPDLEPKAVEHPPPIPQQSNSRAVAAKSPAKDTTRRTRSPSPSPSTVSTPAPVDGKHTVVSSKGKAPAAAIPVDGSETEEESDEDDNKAAANASALNKSHAKAKELDIVMRSPSPTRTAASSNPPPSKRPTPAVVESDSDAEPKPAAAKAHKKPRMSSSSDNDSDAKPNQATARKGARQPVKRGGKRF